MDARAYPRERAATRKVVCAHPHHSHTGARWAGAGAGAAAYRAYTEDARV